jgi:hypothetical protein
VNETEIPLDVLIVGQGGSATADDAVITVSCDENSFKDVIPHEAIKVAEYDGYYDVDFVLGIDLTIEVEGVRHFLKFLVIKTTPKKPYCFGQMVGLESMYPIAMKIKPSSKLILNCYDNKCRSAFIWLFLKHQLNRKLT